MPINNPDYPGEIIVGEVGEHARGYEIDIHFPQSAGVCLPGGGKGGDGEFGGR
ncbi:hypothetical protein GCM10009560_76270 [Nonomuraea longicatena]|uniref:Uncharacterized protein n=1 Tax=Nonomuraea longicatena TaxID=83682 RepID=A0ABN1R8M8_9ACTN